MSDEKPKGSERQPWFQLPGCLTVRDYFAGQALVVIGAHGRIGDAPPSASIASMAYQVADAMLRERAKQP